MQNFKAKQIPLKPIFEKTVSRIQISEKNND